MPNEQIQLSETQLATNAPKSEISHLIEVAIGTGKSPEFLRELLAVRREWEADEARKAYSSAKSDFQARSPIIEKQDTAYDKKYARMDRIWRETRQLRADTGLSVTWNVCELREGGICHVEGSLCHRQGHSEPLRMDVPIPELVKGQNKAQQMGSAYTYAQRYAFCAALGIVTGDDDDGNNAGSVFVTKEQADEITEMVEVCRGINTFNEAKFWQYAGAKDSAFQIRAERFADIKRFLQIKMKGQA
jgi:hypothetical protein